MSKGLQMLKHVPGFRALNWRHFCQAWRKENPGNFTTAGCLFPRHRVKVGNGSYGMLHVHCFEQSSSMLRIGHYCSIAPEVSFLLDGEHLHDTPTTYPFKARYLHQEEGVSKGDIVVGDDVWIGYRATVLSGSHIGQGAIVAAGALVTGDIPPYAIVGGVPAKVIKYRFPKELIDALLEVDFSQLTPEAATAQLPALYQKLERKEQLDWLPKRNA